MEKFAQGKVLPEKTNEEIFVVKDSIEEKN